jgi:hypothetical protein
MDCYIQSKYEHIERFSQLFSFVKFRLCANGKISSNYANFLANEFGLFIIMQIASLHLKFSIFSFKILNIQRLNS